MSRGISSPTNGWPWAPPLKAWKSFHDTAEGGAGSLSSQSKYSALAELAPTPLHLMMYVDIAGILEVIVDGLDEDDLDDYEEDVRPFVENLSAFMVASSLSDDRWALHCSPDPG